MLAPEAILNIQTRVAGVHTSGPLLDYILDLLAFTRDSPHFHVGLSPRAGLGLQRAAQSWAYLHGRDHVLPEDVQMVLPWVTGHRLRGAGDYRELTRDALRSLLMEVPVP